MSRTELLALAGRIRERDADMKLRGGKIQRVFRGEMPMVIEALETAAASSPIGQASAEKDG